MKRLEKYFGTEDEHFNHNAYYWYMELKESDLFENIETPFMVLRRYLWFLKNYQKPFSCVEDVLKDFDKLKLTDQQKLFILDKFTGLIANADPITQERLALINVELTDTRIKIQPYGINLKEYTIEHILKEAETYKDPLEQIKFLKLKRLNYRRVACELGWDIGLGAEIDIEIEHIEKTLERGPTESIKPTFLLSKDKGDKIDFIRVMNALFELGFFLDNRRKKPTKKVFMKQIGAFFGTDLANYDANLGDGLNRGEALNLEIFERLKEKHKEIWDAKQEQPEKMKKRP